MCVNEHADNCAIDLSSEQFEDLRKESYFGVIDLETMRLTSLPKGESYAALSYTWGRIKPGETRFRTTLQNVDDLKEEWGIYKVEEQLPLTIRDAMKLVRELGIRYLWVDSLCILQGDADLWALNASRMDSVYGYASLTICAADGEDAHCGLKALHPPSRYGHHDKQCVERIMPDMQLMVAYPSENFVKQSV